MKKIENPDWPQVKVGDILPIIPTGDSPFPYGGIVKKIEWGTNLYEGAIGDFWVQYPEEMYRFTIIGGKISTLYRNVTLDCTGITTKKIR